ncbi:MAG: ABC transporter permease [Dehalococcoidia bacterium]|tara:strand:- start:9227 stop:10486 length:1260 start_codon:yes stop_codon:yes gene_type:complete
MNFQDLILISLRAIASNGLRSLLTTLGIIIGVSSVIILMSVGQGAVKGVIDELNALGTNLIFIEPGSSDESGQKGAAGSAITLTREDGEAIIEAQIPDVVYVTSMIDFGAQAITPSNNVGVQVVGTESMYSIMRGLNLSEGRFIDEDDVDKKALNMVLGHTISEQLFPEDSPVGKNVRLSIAGGRIIFNFRVVGVTSERGAGVGVDDDNAVFIPVSTLQARISFIKNPTGETNVNNIIIQTAEGADELEVKESISQVLLDKHKVTSPDFIIESQKDLIGAAGEIANILSLLLGGIAGISLAVGGIGVMNIMLVSVTERTREIGIRRAVGATKGDIIKQFVWEALTLSSMGGIIGIILGMIISFSLDGRFTFDDFTVRTVIQPWSILIAFAVSFGIGLVSGVYPAFRASRLDPILALRNE